MSLTQLEDPTVQGLDYRSVWRWHFYASFLCVPFVLWLALTGSVFLFKPQIERLLDRPYDRLSIAHRATANAQAQAALAAVPGGTLDSYVLPRTPTSAAQVLVDRGAQQFRVYVHPETLGILKVDNEDHRFENVVFKLHGELLIGDLGSWMVELAASWAVVMILTGLYLWWPRHATGLGGVLYPRLAAGGRIFWKDLHSVTGVYVSFFALLLLFSGLPWAKGWGGYLKSVRHFGATQAIAQDWTTSSSETVAARMARSPANGMAGHDPAPSASPLSSEHAQHAGHGRHQRPALSGPEAFAPLDTVIATVAPLGLAYPVLVSPPLSAGANWTAKSDTQDRPLRVNLEIDGRTGAIVERSDFTSRTWIDRVVGTGVAAHEGALFGWANQLVSLLTAVGLVMLCVSGWMMWRKRKPDGVLGAPPPLRSWQYSAGLLGLTMGLGIYFPFFGGSLIVVALAERFVLRHILGLRRWLGLADQLA